MGKGTIYYYWRHAVVASCPKAWTRWERPGTALVGVAVNCCDVDDEGAYERRLERMWTWERETRY